MSVGVKDPEEGRLLVREPEGQDAAAIITELLSLDPAPPLVASASALLRG